METRADRQLAIQVLPQSGGALRYLAEELRGDLEVVLLAVANDASAYQFASEALRSTRGFQLHAASRNGACCPFIQQELLAEREFVQEAVSSNWKVFEYASEELRDDKALGLNAVKGNVQAFQWATSRLRNDCPFVLEAVPSSWKVLRYAGEGPCSDKDIILEALRQDAAAIDRTSLTLLGDRNFMLSAVLVNPKTFRVAKKRYASDFDFWLQVVKRCPNGWEQALVNWGPEEIRGMRSIMLECVKQDWRAIKHGTGDVLADAEIVEVAAHKSWEAVEYATKIPLSVMQMAVAQDWRAVRRFMKDKPSETDVVAVINTNPLVVQHPALCTAHYAVLTAVKCNGLTLKYASPKLQNDAKIVDKATSENWRALKFASTEQQNNRVLFEKCFKQNGLAIQFASEALRDDMNFVIEAMKYNIRAFQYSTQKVKEDTHFWQLAVLRVRGAQKLWDKMQREGPKRGEFEERAIQRERAEYAATLQAPPPARAFTRLANMDSEYTPNFWLYRTAEAGASKTVAAGPHGVTPGLVLSKSIKKDWRDD